MNPSCRSFATSATWSIGAVSAEPERTTLSRDPPSNLLVRGWPFESKCEDECMAAFGQRASEHQSPIREVWRRSALRTRHGKSGRSGSEPYQRSARNGMEQVPNDQEIGRSTV